MYCSIMFDIRSIKSNLHSVTAAILPLYGEQTHQDVVFSNQQMEQGIINAVSEFLYLSLVGYTPDKMYQGSDIERVEYALAEYIGLHRNSLFIQLDGNREAPNELMMFLVNQFIAIRYYLQTFIIRAIETMSNHSTIEDLTIHPSSVANLYSIIIEFTNHSSVGIIDTVTVTQGMK